MSKEPDPELKKAFRDLHEKEVETMQKLKLADMQIESLSRLKQRNTLMIKEISTLPAETRVYESVGRMFLLEDVATFQTQFQKNVVESGEKVKTLEGTKEHLQKNLKESENNVREMIIRKKSTDSSG